MKSFWKKSHFTLKIGTLMLVFGSGPLLVLMSLHAMGLMDPGNFAYGAGPLAGLTLYPALILILIGVILSKRNSKKTE